MVGWIVLALAAVFVAVLLVRAACVKRPAEAPQAPQAVEVDAAAADRLAQMVRIPTVSNVDESLVDNARFVEFRALLARLYPRLHAACPPVLCGRTGLVFYWRGKSSAEPAVLMAHYDVVPVTKSEWKHAPFCGEVYDGELWGRGTLDTKITLLGILEAAEQKLSEGFVPAQDVYLAFAGDEEVNGHGAEDIIAWMKARSVVPAFVLDEGGAVVERVVPGISLPIAAVGIGEKGVMNLTLTAAGEGGHASHPVTPSVLGRVCRAVARCEAHPFPAHLTRPVREMLETLAPYAPFGERLLLANLWCFGWLLRALAGKLGGEVNAMMRTTMAFTMAKGSPQVNVMPSEASAGVNMRLVHNDTPEDVLAYMNRVVADPRVTVRADYVQPASAYAAASGEHWEKLSRAIRETWRGCVVSPYLMIACSDSRHYSGYAGDVYKFSAMQLSSAQRGLIHNADERIPLTEIPRTVEFFVRLLGSL